VWRARKDSLKPVAGASDRHLPFLHRLKQSGLSLRRRAIDFVREQEVSKDGAALKAKHLLPALALDDDVGSDNVCWHQVRRKLHARKIKPHRFAERTHQKRLPQPRNAFEQDVAARHQREQSSFDQLLLPDDDAAYLGSQGIEFSDVAINSPSYLAKSLRVFHSGSFSVIAARLLLCHQGILRRTMSFI
jgi:hypothetical protein